MTEYQEKVNVQDRYCTREHYQKCVDEKKPITSNVRIHRNLCKSKTHPVVATIVKDNIEIYEIFTLEGRYGLVEDHPFDIIRIPKQRTGFMNIDEDGWKKVFDTESDAVKNRTPYFRRCVEVFWME